MPLSKRKISYFYDDEYTGFYYGADHPMKPQRIAMTHSLVLGYGLDEHLDIFEELLAFHGDEYLEMLRRTTPEQASARPERYYRFGVDLDCPVFHGLFDFCRLYAGASLDASRRLAAGRCDVAINWAGGLHHAKKHAASGFCYVNDIVLGILELLRVHARVMYIDIDVHHGDGVEEAFYATDRVLTVSFHLKREGFFPGTGAADDAGEGAGRGYALNVPLEEGIEDEQYLSLFRDVVAEAVARFRPGAICLQCGADSVKGDRLGPWNVSVRGHAQAVAFVKSLGLPMLVVGGGGYIKTTVARAWTLETATLAGVDLDDALPPNPYYEYFGPEYRIHQDRSRPNVNYNKKDSLEKVKREALEHLRALGGAPSVTLDARPPEALLFDVRAVRQRERDFAQKMRKAKRQTARPGPEPDAIPAAAALPSSAAGALAGGRAAPPVWVDLPRARTLRDPTAVDAQAGTRRAGGERGFLYAAAVAAAASPPGPAAGAHGAQAAGPGHHGGHHASSSHSKGLSALAAKASAPTPPWCMDADGETERLQTYVQEHFPTYLWCAEEGHMGDD